MAWFKRRKTGQAREASYKVSGGQPNGAAGVLAVFGLQPVQARCQSDPLSLTDAELEEQREQELWESVHLHLM
jgi:hypothetical protein